MFFGDRLHRLLQHAINTVLDDDGIVVSLNMDVTGAALQSGEDGSVHQANDRTHLRVARQLLDGDGLFAVVGLADDVKHEALAGFVENALRLLRLLEDVTDLRERGDLSDDALVEEKSN